MARKKNTYRDLCRLAKEYGADKNQLYLQAARQYEIQAAAIEKINEIMVEGSTEEFLMAAKDLPRHCEAASRTLNTMRQIIADFGRPPEQRDDLDEFLADG